MCVGRCSNKFNNFLFFGIYFILYQEHEFARLYDSYTEEERGRR